MAVMRAQFVLMTTFVVLTALACGDDKDADGENTETASSDSDQPGDSDAPGNSDQPGGDSDDEMSETVEPIDAPSFDEGPAAGNLEGKCSVPSEAVLEDVSHPDQVVGDGTKDSCTGQRVIDAVAAGGVITFECGPDPVTITLDQPAKVFNDSNPVVTIDGGGLVTLSGGGKNRILYMNTCDEKQKWTTAHCDNQDHPRLTVQNLTLINGNSKNDKEFVGGGAIYASGGRFKVINSRFFNNVCADTGADVGGGAIRVFQQFEGRPAYVVNTTFGGSQQLGNECSNGGGLSSIGVSWSIFNSLFSYNRAVGNGGNPAENGTPGGGRWWRHLQRRRDHGTCDLRLGARTQSGERLRCLNLLCQQQSRRHGYAGVDYQSQQRRRLLVQLVARHLDARRHPR